MIQANELRIGNWLYFDTNTKPFQATIGTIKEIFDYSDKEMPFNYQPIPPHRRMVG
jgi:hypothetical protein